MMMILSTVADETGDGFHGINRFVHGTDCFQLSWKGNEIGMRLIPRKAQALHYLYHHHHPLPCLILRENGTLQTS
eukprot:scaffold1562_cov297-Ochromonas_danica.AAC.1